MNDGNEVVADDTTIRDAWSCASCANNHQSRVVFCTSEEVLARASLLQLTKVSTSTLSSFLPFSVAPDNAFSHIMVGDQTYLVETVTLGADEFVGFVAVPREIRKRSNSTP